MSDLFLADTATPPHSSIPITVAVYLEIGRNDIRRTAV